jgi:hypothetical protein
VVDLLKAFVRVLGWVVAGFGAAFLWIRQAKKEERAEAERDAMQQDLSDIRLVHDARRAVERLSDDELDGLRDPTNSE